MYIKNLQLPYTGTIKRITNISSQLGGDWVFIHFTDSTELNILQSLIQQPLECFHDGDTITITKVRDMHEVDGRIISSLFSITLQ